MSDNISSLVDKMFDDIEVKIRSDVKSITNKAKKDFEKKATEAVLLYYFHYKPILYNRTYNLSDNVIDVNPPISMSNKTIYSAWIMFNPGKMNDYKDGGDKVLVVDSFMKGWHGKNNSRYNESMPAITIMDTFQMNYKKTLDGYFKNLGYKVKR